MRILPYCMHVMYWKFSKQIIKQNKNYTVVSLKNVIALALHAFACRLFPIYVIYFYVV